MFSAVLAFAGCGQEGSSSPVIKIGCVAPLTGDQAKLGTDTCNGAQVAIDQANAEGKGLPGFKFELVVLDDQHNPSQAVNMANRLASDPDVVGVVGHFNSSCTKPASAIYASSDLTSITAVSTNPELSRQGFPTFFRTCATDDVQGPRGAAYAFHKLGFKKIFIIDDKTTYGKGLADEFDKKARELGFEVLGHEGITQGDKDFTPLLTKIKPLQPEIIYFGGIYPEGALLIRQARGLDIKSVFMGGDGLAAPTLIELASAEIVEGTYATMVGGDIKAVPEAADFVRVYESKYGAVGQWSAYAFDSANVLIDAVIKAGKKDRLAVLKAMREIPEFKGITGKIVFDERGDNKNQSIGIFKFTGGKLVYIGPAE